MLVFNKAGSGYSVHHQNGVSLGKLEILEDGFFYWFPDEARKGCLSSHVLLCIGRKLEELNEKWELDLVKTLSNHPSASE